MRLSEFVHHRDTRLSEFLVQAVSLAELQAKYPDIAWQLDQAVKSGVKNKYLGWLALRFTEKRQEHLNRPDAEDIIAQEMKALDELTKRFDKVLETKKLDRLIETGKLPPQAKDIGWWYSKPLADFVSTVDAAEKEPIKLKPQFIKGSEKIYDDGALGAYWMKTYEAVKTLGKDTSWCITQQVHFDNYTENGHKFVFLTNRNDPGPMGKVALAFDKDGDVTGWDAEDSRIRESDVKAAYPNWEKVKAAILKTPGLFPDPIAKLFSRANKGDATLFNEGLGNHPTVDLARTKNDRKDSLLHALIRSVSHDHLVWIMKELVKRESWAKLPGVYGRSSLHAMAYRMRHKIPGVIKLLLSHPLVGTLHTPKTDGAKTPLHVLASLQVIDVLKHPLVAKTLDAHLRTPLHTLTEADEEIQYSEQEVKAILAHPKVASVFDKSGDTPLHNLAQAAAYSTLNIVSLVFGHRKSKSVKNKRGKTPKDLYQENKRYQAEEEEERRREEGDYDDYGDDWN